MSRLLLGLLPDLPLPMSLPHFHELHAKYDRFNMQCVHGIASSKQCGGSQPEARAGCALTELTLLQASIPLAIAAPLHPALAQP